MAKNDNKTQFADRASENKRVAKNLDTLGLGSSSKEVEKMANYYDAKAKGDEETAKTLETGYDINPETQTGAAAIRQESLSSDIKVLAASEQDLVFYNDLPKIASDNVVQQYTVLTGYGESGASRFVSEPNVASVSDPQMAKKHVNMKYVSDTAKITFATQLANNNNNPMDIATQTSVLNVARTIEWACFYGNSDLTNQENGNGLQFDGLEKLISKDNVIDVRGEALSEDILNIASTYIRKGFGTPTDAYMPSGVYADFTNKYLPRQVQIQSDNNGSTTVGFQITNFNSANGNIALHGSAVMDEGLILDEETPVSNEAPSSPKIAVTTKTGDGGKFSEKKGDLASPLKYKATVTGTKGVSPASEPAEVAVTQENSSVTVEITVEHMYGQDPQFVTVYRQSSDGNYYKIGDIPANKVSPEGKFTFVDRNERIPGTVDVFVGDRHPQVISLYEFLPMTRVQLARQDATDTFTILWYGALALFAPKRWVQIKNVEYIPVKNPYRRV